MSIYTKTGDKGETSLFAGKRVSKADLQIETYGSIDELTSFIGLVIVKLTDKEEQAFLTTIQNDLYLIMGSLAGSKNSLESLATKVELFEQKIDKLESTLPELHKFILPGGTELSALFHIVRTVCRRAERYVVRFSQTSDIQHLSFIIQYLNRLSDLFFDLARWYNKDNELLTSYEK